MDMMSQTSGDVAVPVLPDFEATTAQSYYWKRNAALPGDPAQPVFPGQTLAGAAAYVRG